MCGSNPFLIQYSEPKFYREKYPSQEICKDCESQNTALRRRRLSKLESQVKLYKLKKYNRAPPPHNK